VIQTLINAMNCSSKKKQYRVGAGSFCHLAKAALLFARPTRAGYDLLQKQQLLQVLTALAAPPPAVTIACDILSMVA